MPNTNNDQQTTAPWILHIDGDGFFAYCEISRFPHLKGKPVVVGAERGIACAMTYEAKKLGITRAMPIFKIRDQFPQVTILPSHFELYEHYAQKLAHILEPQVHTLERYSIDECFALMHLPSIWTKAECQTWLKHLKTDIQNKIGLTYSFGMARTKVLAKLASKYEKPDGCTVITTEDETDLLQHTAIADVWGIGWGLQGRFERMRVKTAYEFAQWPKDRVMDSFNAPVVMLWHELNGRNFHTVGSDDSLPKSLQSTRSFLPSTTDPAFITAELLHNADVVCARMRVCGVSTAMVSIHIKTTERRYHRTAIILPDFTNNVLDMSHTIADHVQQLIRKGTRYKATGITVWGLKPTSRLQTDLFDTRAVIQERGAVMTAVDAIKARYGNSAIGIAGTLPSMLHRKQIAAKQALTDKYVHGLPLPYLGEVT